MFDDIDESYREQTARIFKVVIDAIESLSMVALAIVGQEKGSLIRAQSPGTPCKSQEITATYENIQKKVNARHQNFASTKLRHPIYIRNSES